MTMLDNLSGYLRQKHGSEEGRLWSPVRQNNWVRLHQTPNAWGQPMNRDGVMGRTNDSVGRLANAMQSVIESASSVVDITSLDPPRGPAGENSVFYNAIRDGIRARASRGRFTVRMLFGKPPQSGRDEVHRLFKERLAQDLGNLRNISIVFGVYAATSSTGPVFNHSKIFASDTAHAVVGGHNLYHSDYNQYPPVHDVSVEVRGPAAIDARNFASYLWSFGIADPHATMRSDPITSITNRTSTWIVAWQLLNGRWTPINNQQFQALRVGHQYPPTDTAIPSPAGDGWCRAKILTVGRAGGWAHILPGDHNASDYMKKWLISNAATSIKIAHQDLVAMDLYGMTHISHATCKNLGNALYKKDELRVYVVVTAPYGSGLMDVYFNAANGPQTAADYIMYYARPTIGTGGIRGVDDLARIRLWNRLFVAPIHFTDQIPSPNESHYYWPNAENVVSAGGSLAKKDFPKSVGQHMKTMIIDDTIMVVGSDNHYPHPLAEINYVLEGDIVNKFKTEFWDPLWRYSGPHAVQQWNALTTISGG